MITMVLLFWIILENSGFYKALVTFFKKNMYQPSPLGCRFTWWVPATGCENSFSCVTYEEAFTYHRGQGTADQDRRCSSSELQSLVKNIKTYLLFFGSRILCYPKAALFIHLYLPATSPGPRVLEVLNSGLWNPQATSRAHLFLLPEIAWEIPLLLVAVENELLGPSGD